jgi:hypothetical protein
MSDVKPGSAYNTESHFAAKVLCRRTRKVGHRSPRLRLTHVIRGT